MKLVQKIRPNVLILCVMVAGLVYYFAAALIPQVPVVSSEILALLVGIGIGGLIGIAGSLAQDGPPDHMGRALDIIERVQYHKQRADRLEQELDDLKQQAARSS